MDAKEFDRLVKSMSGAADRRRLLAGLGAALAGSLGGLDVAAKGKRRGRVKAADDTPKPNGKKCVKPAQCQSGHCCKSASAKHGVCQACCANEDCGTCKTCSNGTCGGVATNFTPCQTASSTSGQCCAGSCCPSPCACGMGAGGTFCISNSGLGQGCRTDDDCELAGTSCQGGVCFRINCTGNPAACPAGSRCLDTVGCWGLCTTA